MLQFDKQHYCKQEKKKTFNLDLPQLVKWYGKTALLRGYSEFWNSQFSFWFAAVRTIFFPDFILLHLSPCCKTCDFIAKLIVLSVFSSVSWFKNQMFLWRSQHSFLFKEKTERSNFFTYLVKKIATREQTNQEPKYRLLSLTSLSYFINLAVIFFFQVMILKVCLLN